MTSLLITLDESTLNGDDVRKIMDAIAMIKSVTSVDFNDFFFSLEPGKIRNFRYLIGEFEDYLIRKAMAKAKGSKSAAAKLLGMGRTSLVERYKKVTGAPEPDRRPTLRELRKRGEII